MDPGQGYLLFTGIYFSTQTKRLDEAGLSHAPTREPPKEGEVSPNTRFLATGNPRKGRDGAKWSF